MTELTQLDLFLREIECYDMKWFAEIGGHVARREVERLREAVLDLENLAEANRETIGDLLLWQEAARKLLERANRALVGCAWGEELCEEIKQALGKDTK